MKKILLELKRYIISPIFAVAVLSALAIMAHPIFDSLKAIFINPQSYLYYISGVHTFGSFDLFAPVIAAAPCSATFYNDFGSGYCKFILPRTSRIKYLLSKIFTCGVTGGLAVFLPNFILFIYLFAFGKPHSSDMNILQGSTLGAIEYTNNGLNVMIILLLLSFLFGFAWSLIGLAVSAFIPNKYVALVAPFLTYFALSTTLSLTDESLVFSPINMLYPNYSQIPSIAFCFTYQLILIAMSAVIFIIRAYRRLKDAL